MFLKLCFHATPVESTEGGASAIKCCSHQHLMAEAPVGRKPGIPDRRHIIIRAYERKQDIPAGLLFILFSLIYNLAFEYGF